MSFPTFYLDIDKRLWRFDFNVFLCKYMRFPQKKGYICAPYTITGIFRTIKAILAESGVYIYVLKKTCMSSQKVQSSQKSFFYVWWSTIYLCAIFFTQYVPVVSHGLLWLQNNLGT